MAGSTTSASEGSRLPRRPALAGLFTLAAGQYLMMLDTSVMIVSIGTVAGRGRTS